MAQNIHGVEIGLSELPLSRISPADSRRLIRERTVVSFTSNRRPTSRFDW